MPDLLDHPLRANFLRRLEALKSALSVEFAGSVYRSHSPRYARAKELFAGKGGRYANGRWMRKSSVHVVYTSLDPETALAEAFSSSRYYRLPLAKALPLVLVSTDVNLHHVLDLTDGATRQRLRLGISKICRTDWRGENHAGREALTQAWGWVIQKAGFEALRVSSAITQKSCNLIIFPDNLHGSSRVCAAKEIPWPKA